LIACSTARRDLAALSSFTLALSSIAGSSAGNEGYSEPEEKCSDDKSRSTDEREPTVPLNLFKHDIEIARKA
jgi:hypothetical protein